MLKKLSKREIQLFIDKFQVKCDSITLEKIKEDYFIIIDEVIRFKINKNIIEDFL